MRRLLLATCLSVIPAMAADIYNFSAPNGITVSSPAGFVTGWGYSIQNESSSLWLVTTALSAGTFQYATPTLLFDFPDAAPGATVTNTFDPITSTGLYAILWDSTVPTGFVNSGTFTLSAQWWSGNPANGGTFVSTAPIENQLYSASLTPTPEPSAFALAGLAVTALVIAAQFRRRRPASSARSEPT